MIEKYVSQFLKAHMAGLVAAMSLVITDLHSAGTLAGVSSDQWIGIAGAFAAAFGLVAAVPNSPAVPSAPAVEIPSVPQDEVPAAA